MMNDEARVSLVAQATGALACELCTAEATLPNTTLVVHHPRGGVVQLAACDWCVQALRRLSAATGGHAVFALGRPRADGTWEGWLEFVAIGAAVVLRTEQETTQSNRQAVAYWASGLEPAYLEGAFSRARKESIAAVSV
jgi:hypothetical protein